MDDYSTAFISRCLDTNRLYLSKRKIAAMHLGGITIECFLKKTCFIYHGINDWNQISNRTGVSIANPRHRISNLVTIISSLHIRANASPDVMQAIRHVQEPCGMDYILWRYHGVEPSQGDFEEWYKSYVLLLKWLVVQVKTL
ncbi:hypothetical protein [Bacillus sp. FJAT-27245]|uniref:hypothetical protein n=1 Tax=Bacillus sp. FJAT-27245 TaxID=1684144 RepID=UPI0006A772DB|nr:hypothetical protein [Bacillus sp. FJAT-27245]